MSAPDATLGRVERMVALRSFPGWGDLDSRDLATVAAVSRTRRVEAGEVLNADDHPVTSVFLVVTGALRVSMDGAETGVFREHSAVGGLATFSGIERGYAIEAAEDTVCLEIAAPDMEEIFEDRFPILLRALRAMARTTVELRKSLPRAGFSNVVNEGPICPARPLDLVERIFFLRKNLAMAGRIDSVAVSARMATEVRLGPGEVVWEVGDDGDSMMVLICGRVRCSTPSGQTWEMGANDIIGGLGSLGQLPRWYRVEVVDGVVALVLSRDTSIDVWEDHPDLAMQILGIFARSILDLQRRRSELTQASDEAE